MARNLTASPTPPETQYDHTFAPARTAAGILIGTATPRPPNIPLAAPATAPAHHTNPDPPRPATSDDTNPGTTQTYSRACHAAPMHSPDNSPPSPPAPATAPPPRHYTASL